MTEHLAPLRAAPPSDAFHQISLGSRVLFVCHADRLRPGQLEAELAYWRGLFGAQVEHALLHGGDDFELGILAIAIQELHDQGIGVTRSLLADLGFAPDLLARRYDEALAFVRSVNPPAAPAAGNVIAFPRR